MKFKLMLFSCIVVCASLHAGGLLNWETTQVTQKVAPTASSVDAVFKFKNIGTAPVIITEVKPSCGCTTAKLEKLTYGPGESGEIRATLDVGSRQGLQSKTIRVVTDELDDNTTVLTMKTLIPKVVEIKPGFVYWSKGDSPEPRSATVTIDLDEPVKIKAAESNHSGIVVHLREVESGKRYQVEMFPLTTDETFRATIALKTDYPNDSPKTFYVHAHVK